jgi:adenylate cyclase
VAIQDGVAERNRPVLTEQRLEFRIGVHTADVVIESDDILGDGVNVAARLEGLALPGGICVSSRVWEDAQGRLELGFYDLGEQHLKNIPRPIRVYRVVTAGSDGADMRSSLPLPAKPSIAVLPFHNMSGDPEQEYFADALTEDIVTALSRWRWFFVIARDSSFAYKGQKVDATRVGAELGVRYILEGSVRKAGARVRVNAQLIDASTGANVWADTLDREMVDIFALQDDLTEQVVPASRARTPATSPPSTAPSAACGTSTSSPRTSARRRSRCSAKPSTAIRSWRWATSASPVRSMAERSTAGQTSRART